MPFEAAGLKIFFVGLHTCESLDEGFRLMLNQNLGHQPTCHDVDWKIIPSAFL